MRSRRASALVMVGLACALLGAASAPKPPSIAFGLKPEFVGCHTSQLPNGVTASWHIVHDVAKATITGAVDNVGGTLPPIAISTKGGRRGVVGTKKLYLLCSATTQVLTLTATGKGGTTTVTASLRENRAD